MSMLLNYRCLCKHPAWWHYQKPGGCLFCECMGYRPIDDEAKFWSEADQLYGEGV